MPSEISGNMQRIFRSRYKTNEPGLVSHITQRAAGREPLFLEKSDYLTMLGLLRESAEKFDLCYYALCLMPNHIHILIEPQQRNLFEAMRSVFSRYAAGFNFKYQRRGHLFGGTYRQSVCLDSTYLLAASVYIHLNPVRAGLIDKAGKYRWSSCSLYCHDRASVAFVNPNPVLGLLHDDAQVARKEYGEILKKAHHAELENVFEQDGVIERFCMQLAEIFPGLFRRLSSETKHTGSLLELTRLESKIQELTGSRARSMESRKAKKYVIEQLLARGFKKREIADRLGISSRAVYNMLNSPELI